MIRRAIFILLLLAFVPARAADAPADLDTLFRQLDDDDWRVRDQATSKLAERPDALPRAQALVRRPDVSPEVRQRLLELIPDWGKRGAVSERTRQRQAVLARYRDDLLAQYDRVGRRDPKWDAGAREVIVQHTGMPADKPIRPAVAKLAAAEQKLIDIGCDDPLILLMFAIDQERLLKKAADPYHATERAAAAVLGSGYGPRVKATTLVARARAFHRHCRTMPNEFEQRQINADYDAAVAILPQLKDAPAPDADANLRLAMDLIALREPRFEQRDGPARDALLAALEGAEPGSIQPMRLLVRVNLQLAREQDQGTEVGKRRARRFEDAAREASESAWQRQASAGSAILRLRVAAARADHAGMREWYEQALKLDPDNLDARQIMVDHPTDQESLNQLANQYLQTDRFEPHIKLLGATALIKIGLRMPLEEQPAYFQQPAVWDRVKEGYAAVLDLSPQDDATRSAFAYWSCYAGQWKTAVEQFQILGDHVDDTLFGSEAVVAYYRAKAKRLAAR